MEKIAIVFPGQGAQYVGMGESFYKNYLICRQTYEEASDVAGIDMVKLCFQGPVTKLNCIHEMQLAVVTTDVAIARAYLQEYGIQPQFCLGHSVGEYAALVCAGAIQFSDAICMLDYRGRLLTDAMQRTKGIMLVVENISRQQMETMIIEEELQRQVFIASSNTKMQLLLSGTEEGLDRLQELLIDADARVTPLLSSPPMHSPLLQSLVEPYRQYLQGLRFYPFRLPVISNAVGRPISNPQEIPTLLSEHLVRPVLWMESIQCCQKYGVTMILEAGPKNLLLNMVKETAPDIALWCFGQKKDREQLNDEFLKDPNYQKDVPNFVGRCMGIAVSTPNANSDAQAYKVGVVEPYKQLQKLQETIRGTGSRLTVEDMAKAIRYLKQIMETKKVDEMEQQNWLKSLLDETNTYYLLKDELVN